jgi:hypothetical protein
LRQRAEELPPILIVAEGLAAFVASGRHMVEGSWKFDSDGA